jgi:hypothetical protein
MCKWMLKSLDTTGTLLKQERLSNGSDSRRLSTQITIDSTPPAVKGRLDSYAASSDGCPLTGALPLGGGAGLALGSAFLGSAGAGLPPGPTFVGDSFAVSSIWLRTGLRS